MKRIIFAALAFIWLVFLVYLLLPSPSIPSLPNSLKSTEEGDVSQIPGVSAYYTDSERKEVVKFYSEQFSRSPLGNLPFFQLQLNHPIEYSRQVIRDPFQASYVEEIVHPFRESLIIAGWEPVNAPAQFYNQSERLPIIVGQRQFYAKATLRYFDSNLSSRVLILILLTAAALAIFYNFRKILRQDEIF